MGVTRPQRQESDELPVLHLAQWSPAESGAAWTLLWSCASRRLLRSLRAQQASMQSNKSTAGVQRAKTRSIPGRLGLSGFSSMVMGEVYSLQELSYERAWSSVVVDTM